MREFCDTIATSIARYEKYRCWASKDSTLGSMLQEKRWTISAELVVRAAQVVPETDVCLGPQRSHWHLEHGRHLRTPATCISGNLCAGCVMLGQGCLRALLGEHCAPP